MCMRCVDAHRRWPVEWAGQWSMLSLQPAPRTAEEGRIAPHPTLWTVLVCLMQHACVGVVARCAFICTQLHSINTTLSSSDSLWSVYGGIPLRLSTVPSVPRLGLWPDGSRTQWLTLHVTRSVGEKNLLTGETTCLCYIYTSTKWTSEWIHALSCCLQTFLSRGKYHCRFA